MMASATAGLRLLEAAITGPMRYSIGRTVLAVIVIALGVALGLAVTLVNRSAADEVSIAARSLFGLADVVVAGGARGFDESLYPAIAQVPGVALASPVVDVAVRVAGARRSINVLGLDFFRAGRMQPDIGIEPGYDGLGSLTDDALLLSPAAARTLSLGQGDTLALQVGVERIEFRIAGLLPGTVYRDEIAVMDIGLAQWRLQQLGQLQRIELRLAQGARIDEVMQRIRDLVPADVEVTTPGTSTDEAVRLSRAYRANLTALALVALFTGAFLVYSTQSLAVLRRRREFGLMRALGVTPREQRRWILWSGALVGGVGAALGAIGGVFIADLGLEVLGGDLGAGYFRGVTPTLILSPVDVAVFVALGILAAVAGTFQPALMAARVPAAVALKAGDIAEAEVRGHWIPGLLCWMAALALLGMPPIDGLPLAGYAAIALLLIGAVSWVPFVTRALLRGLPQRGSVVWQLAAAQLRGTARQVTMSIAAILVSFSLMVAMAIMVTSFRVSLDDWMQKILPADLYLRVGPAQTSYLDVAHLATLRDVPGVATVVGTRNDEITLVPPDGRASTFALSARPIDIRTAERTLWLAGSQADSVPADHVPLWLSESAADLLDVAAGQSLAAILHGRTISVVVAGLYRDYERQTGAVTMDRETYMHLTGDERVNAAWLWLQPAADLKAAAVLVRERLPREAQYDIREPGEIRGFTLAIFDRTFAVTYLLEAIAVLIGLTGIAASTSAQILARRAEFGMLRHLGFTYRQTASMLALEGAVLSAVGVIAGLAVGGLVSLVLIYVVNRQSFHWSMDLHVPGLLLCTLAGILILAGALTAVLSGRLALRRDVVAAVKEDW